MAKKHTIFECQFCGWQSAKWLGKCSSCGSWDALVELKEEQISAKKQPLNSNIKATPITQVHLEEITHFSSCEEEFDIVLGGGIVPGGLYLIGGSPGVGKSTLLLKIAGNLATKAHKRVLYVSGEESAGQIKMRASRLNAMSEELFLLNEIDLNIITNAINEQPYSLCVIDSIQTIYSPEITSAPGSISQVREVTFALMRLAKERNISIFIIGHITKEGAIAGPRILEHMVDCVLYFEGDPSKELRMLRGFKNRFGSTSEIGIFEMKENGLVSAKNASQLFFTQKSAQAGSAIAVVLEGSRALVIEIQALVSESGYPRRACTGFDSNRLNMLLALLERKLEIPLGRYDVFVNVVGGIRINETSADLAVIASIISSFRNRPLNAKTAFVGEVSLVGDIREVSNIDVRLKELSSYGFQKVILAQKPSNPPAGLKCFEANEVSKILEWM
ncbi:DNA repair protein RadA [Helicobacter typhlonius]|uniref:DNA repair protein RadA n=1 Tax=Helicobacter typhlonius TaxID=76936 RepID=UPI002FDFE3FB